MPDHVYLDTSALVRRAEASVASPTPRNTHAGAPVTTLLAAPPGPVATSEVGLLEFHDVVMSMLRNTDAVYRTHDQAWSEAVIDAVMEDVASEHLEVRPVLPKIFEHVMTLVTMTTRLHGRKFRVWDALHLVTATAWSTEVGEQVELWTTDDDFEGFVGLFPHFGRAVVVRNLDN